MKTLRWRSSGSCGVRSCLRKKPYKSNLIVQEPIDLLGKPCAMNLVLTLYWHYGELCGSYAMRQFSLVHYRA